MLWLRCRYVWRLVSELALKYKFALFFGFILGFTSSLGLLRVAPILKRQFFTPTERVGVVGDYTPTTLPLFIQHLISFGLATAAPDGSTLPGLAHVWEATDSGKRYVFHLRGDIRWHTGASVVAKDVNYNIRDVTFTWTDSQTLVANLRQPYSPFPTLVVKPLFAAGLVGFGPYRVDTVRLRGDFVQHLKLVPIDSSILPVKEFRFYRTESQAILAYKRGDIDVLPDLFDPRSLAQWGKNNVIITTRYDRVIALFFYMKDTRLAQRSFRQALSYGVPQQEGEEAVLSPFPKSSWAQSDTVKKYRYDEEQVEKLLKASAVSSSSAELTLSTFLPFTMAADSIAKQWTSLGIPTKVKIVNDITEGFQVLLTSQTLPADPDQYPLWHSTQKDSNITGYSSAKIDKLLEDGRIETDIEKRKKIYADFARRLTDEVPVRFLYYPKTYTISRRK